MTRAHPPAPTLPPCPRAPSFERVAAALLAALLLSAGAGLARAERADRSQPIVLEADKRGTVDTRKQTTVLIGNVVITQGTLQVRAERVEIQEAPDGFRTAVALGSAQQPAFFKQRREASEETVEGTAERIDFEEKNDTLRLTGNPVVRRMLGSKMIDEVTGTLITWDNRTEFFTVDGGARTAANPTGRVRMLLSPRQAASSPAAGASPPPKTPNSTKAANAPQAARAASR